MLYSGMIFIGRILIFPTKYYIVIVGKEKESRMQWGIMSYIEEGKKEAAVSINTKIKTG